MLSTLPATAQMRVRCSKEPGQRSNKISKPKGAKITCITEERKKKIELVDKVASIAVALIDTHTCKQYLCSNYLEIF